MAHGTAPNAFRSVFCMHADPAAKPSSTIGKLTARLSTGPHLKV